jgi:hypothetical protein
MRRTAGTLLASSPRHDNWPRAPNREVGRDGVDQDITMNCATRIRRACLAMPIIAMVAWIAIDREPATGEEVSGAGEIAKPSAGAAVPSSTATTGRDIVWRADRVCGLNCLYFLLRSFGKEPDYVSMQGQMLKRELTSLYDMKTEAARYGVTLELAKMSLDELRKAPMPAIAHTEVVDVTGHGGGHFVVVVSVGDDHVHAVDGTTAEFRLLPRRDFERTWSGYVAYHKQPAFDSWPTLSLALLGGVVLGTMLDRLLFRLRRRQMSGATLRAYRTS